MNSNTSTSNATNNPSISTVNTVTTNNVASSSTNASNISSATNSTTINNGSEWTEHTIQLLINQRKYRNREYYQIIGRSRTSYWESIARRINRDAGSNFTGRQCSRKFNNLVSHYYVSKLCRYKKYGLLFNNS